MSDFLFLLFLGGLVGCVGGLAFVLVGLVILNVSQTFPDFNPFPSLGGLSYWIELYFEPYLPLATCAVVLGFFAMCLSVPKP